MLTLHCYRWAFFDVPMQHSLAESLAEPFAAGLVAVVSSSEHTSVECAVPTQSACATRWLLLPLQHSLRSVQR